MKQQTAVDFFFTKVLGSLHISMSKTDIDELLIESKQMEKEQIIDAYYGQSYSTSVSNGEQYYNETYGKTK